MQVDRRRVAVRFAVVAVVAAALLYGVGWERVADNLAAAALDVFLAGVFASLLGMVVTAESVRVVLGFPARSRRASLARRAYLGSTFLRSVVPAGNVGGDAFVAYTVGRSRDASVTESVAAVAAWEFLMMVASAVVIGVGVVAIAATGGRADAAVAAFAVVGAIPVAGVAVALALARRRDRVVDAVVRAVAVLRPYVARLGGRFDERFDRDRVRESLDEFAAHVGVLAANRRRLLVALAAVHAGWLLGVAPLYFSARAVGLTVPLAVALVAVPVSGFMRFVPLPGGLGPVDAALGGVVAFFTGYSVAALASALVLYRLATYALKVVVGGAALWSLDRRVVAETAGVADTED